MSWEGTAFIAHAALTHSVLLASREGHNDTYCTMKLWVGCYVSHPANQHVEITSFWEKGKSELKTVCLTARPCPFWAYPGAGSPTLDRPHLQNIHLNESLNLHVSSN